MGLPELWLLTCAANSMQQRQIWRAEFTHRESRNHHHLLPRFNVSLSQVAAQRS